MQLIGFSGPYMAEIAQSLDRLDLKYATLSTNESFGSAAYSWPEPVLTQGPWVLAPSYPQERLTLAQLLSINRSTELFTVIDPSAVVASNSSIGHGSYLNALVSVGANSVLGCSVFLNRSSTVGHDSRLGDFVSTGPGAVISGQVTIGSGSFIGAGAIVRDGISIGINAYIGAGAVVVADVADYALVYGNPAKYQKENSVTIHDSDCPWCKK